MKRILFTPIVLLAFSSMLFISSCDEDLTDINTKPAESALKVITAFADIVLQIDDGLIPDSAKSGMKLAGEDYTETITGDFPNKLYTWDFGPDGDYQGIIKLLLSDEYTNIHAIIQVSFENFVYKGKPVSGTLQIENLGKNTEDMDEYSCLLNQAQVGDNVLSADWKLQRTQGWLTTIQSDDIFTIMQNGADPATGTTQEGDAFSLTITEGLVLDLSCEYLITKGIFDLLYDSTTLNANFGTGECDNLVKTSNGIVTVDVFF